VETRLHNMESGTIMKKVAYVVGGGPSLLGFNFARLYGKDVIAVNQAIFNVPTAKAFVTMDYTFMRKSNIQGGGLVKGPKWQYFTSIPAKKYFVIGIPIQDRQKISADHYVDLAHNLHYRLGLFDHVVEVGGYGGIGTDFNDFHCGSESGYSGLQLAVVLGYTEIHLLGFDFYCNGKQTHFHNQYPLLPDYQTKLDSYCPVYETAAQRLREMNIDLYSHSEHSQLNKWIPYMPLETL